MSDLEKLAALRAPFPPEQINKLPKPTRRDATKGECKECGGYHGLPAVHLDYVGHANVTHRLLDVDPTWTWEPLAYDEHGLPLLDRDGGLWIKLMIAGMTRLGYGDATGSGGMKELIGDAIRNAAMRYGVALDLWVKDDARRTADGERDEPRRTRSSGSAAQPGEARKFDPAKELLEGAIDVQSEQDAVSLRRALAEIEPSLDWTRIEQQAGETAEKGKAQGSWGAAEYGRHWKRLANAVVGLGKLADKEPLGLLTPEQIRPVIAWAFAGAVPSDLADEHLREDAPGSAADTPQSDSEGEGRESQGDAAADAENGADGAEHGHGR